MSNPAAAHTNLASFRFGRFELQPADRRLLEDGEPVNLGARAFDLLVVLAARAGHLVSKNDLLTLVWPGLIVEENNLQVQISGLRKLLGPQIISTIPGRGYRFDGELVGAGDKPGGIAPPSVVPVSTPSDDPGTRLTNLPADLPTLYGREADLAALRALIDGHALVTVVGAGGIGKSRLAQALARSFVGRWPDGVWMVELAGVSDPALLPNAVAQALDIELAGQEAAHDELVAGLGQRELFLVLDNCEHLLAGATALAEAILQRAPQLKVLATSQEPLHLPAEQQYRVMPLPVPSESTVSGLREFGAIALFEARVRAADSRFALTDDNLAVAIDICRRLDGLPLAIELAAARVATLGLRPLRDKLNVRFKLLTGGTRATLRRHQTLRAALEWSYNLLDASERAVFRRLGVFAGGFTMELAQAVAGDAQLDEWAVLDRLSALVDKSLVVVDSGDPPRYRLLESARAFALEQLAEGETAATLRRHALAIREFFEGVDGRHLDGELRTDDLRNLLLPERDNLRAAYAWAIGESGELETGVALAACANALENFAFESADWLVQLQGRVRGGRVGGQVTARYWRAMASTNTTMTGHVPRAVQLEASDLASASYRASDQPRRAFSSVLLRAIHLFATGQDAAAEATVNEARNLMRPDWPAMLRIRLLRMEGHLARRSGKSAEALALYRDGLSLSVSTGDWVLEMMAREFVADLLWETRQLKDASREALALIDDLRERPLTALDMADPFLMAMGIQSEMGRTDEASAIGREALPLLQRAHRSDAGEWAHLFWRRGQLTTAALLLGATDAQQARSGTPLRPNSGRLVAEVRAALEARLGPEALAKGIAGGAALDRANVFALLADALLRPAEE